jgi:drug/metabolite transporter (DMT)-like permease
VTPRAWTAFVTVSIVLGIPYFLIKVAVGEVSPVLISWSRLFLCALILLPLAYARHTLGPAWRRPWWVFGLGVGYIALPFTLIPVAERFISSSLAAIMVATVPLAVAMINLRAERPGALRLTGLLLGFAGVAALVGVDIGGRSSELIGVACMAVVALCYAVGPVVMSRRLKDVDAIGAVSIAAGVGAAALTPPLLLSGLPSRIPSSGALLALLVLGVACTAVGLAAYFFLAVEAGAGRAAVVTYVNPAVAVIVGVALLHERIEIVTAAGFLFILAGSWLATRGRGSGRQVSKRQKGPSTA